MKYVDYRRALSRKRQNKHLRISTDSPQNYIFKFCSAGIFLYNRGPYISFCQLGSRTNIKLRNYPSLLPEFSEFTTFWAAKENEKWEFTENSFGAISRDFQPHPTDRPSFKTVKTKRAIFALIIHVVNDYDSFGINCRGNLWKFFGSDQNHQNQPL